MAEEFIEEATAICVQEILDLRAGREGVSEYDYAWMSSDNSHFQYTLGDIVTVTVDRPLGSYHKKHPDIYYPINYGYIEGVMALDGEEQDAYILGVDKPVDQFTGRIIAIIHRNDDVEEKWVVAPETVRYTKEEIMEQVKFQEQYFDTEIRCLL